MKYVYVAVYISDYPWDADVSLVLDGALTVKQMKERIEKLAVDEDPLYATRAEWKWETVCRTQWTYSYDDGAGGDYGYRICQVKVEDV